jgi:hypothetical protein
MYPLINSKLLIAEAAAAKENRSGESEKAKVLVSY